MSGFPGLTHDSLHWQPLIALPDEEILQLVTRQPSVKTPYIAEYPTRPPLPFSSLNNLNLRQVYRFSPPQPRQSYGGESGMKGNYVAAFVRRDLRMKRRKKSKDIRYDPTLMELPGVDIEEDNEVLEDLRLDLSNILNLHIDILFEILGHVHPIDLYSLTQTSTDMRRFLLTRNASMIWKSAYENHPDVPPCPPSMSYPRWTSFLFGPPTCDMCLNGLAMPDFALQCRLCSACLASHPSRTSKSVVSWSKMSADYPDEQTDLAQMVPYTHRSRGLTYPTIIPHLTRRYLQRDVEEMVMTLRSYCTAIEGNVPGAQDDYEKFSEQTRNKVSEFLTGVGDCERWCNVIHTKIDLEHKERVTLLASRLATHLSRSHEKQDVEAAYYPLIQFLQDKQIWNLSSRARRRHLPIIESMVAEARMMRIKREREDLLEARRAIIDRGYRTFRKTLDPASWAYLPDVGRILRLGVVSKYVDSDSMEVGPCPLESACNIILQFNENWIINARRQLLNTLKISPHFPSPVSGDHDESLFDLASAIFVCAKHPTSENGQLEGPALFGWEDVRRHLNCRGKDDENLEEPYFQYSFEGMQTLSSLLDLIGQDIKTITTRQLDQLNHRFVIQGDSIASHAKTWREIIGCAVDSKDGDDPQPFAFALLTPEVTEIVVFREPLYPDPADTRWSCMHCSAHYKNPVKRALAVSHVVKRHMVDKPQPNVDFFYRPDILPYLPRQQRLVNEAELYACLRCYRQAGPRLRIKHSLLDHLHHCHGVEKPLEDEDWRVVECFAGVASPGPWSTVTVDAAEGV